MAPFACYVVSSSRVEDKFSRPPVIFRGGGGADWYTINGIAVL